MGGERELATTRWGASISAARWGFLVACTASVVALGCQKNTGVSGAASAATKFVKNVSDAVNKTSDAANKVADAADKVANAANAVSKASDAAQGLVQPNATAKDSDNGQPASQGRTSSTSASIQMNSEYGAPSPPAGISPASAPGQAGVRVVTGSSATSAFVGIYLCAASLDFAPLIGNPGHIQGSGPWFVVDNGDGTISIIDPRNKDQCPPARWLVSGSTATASTDRPCAKPDGSVVRVLRGDARLSGNGLTADGALTVAQKNPVQITFSLRCARKDASEPQRVPAKLADEATNSLPDDGVANAAIDNGFRQWSSTWMSDRYLPGSAQVTDRGFKHGTYIIRGVFDFIRGGGRLTIPFAAAFTSSADGYRLSNLCYNDNTSGMTDCIDPSDPRGQQLAGARSRQFLGSIVLLGLVAAMGSGDGENCETRWSSFAKGYAEGPGRVYQPYTYCH